MSTLATVTVAIVALIHILISVVEMFFWMVPFIHERLGYSVEIAKQVQPIVQNAGLYNGFIAVGLIWSAFAKENVLPLRRFFLICVLIAGIFGAITLKPTTLILQTLPAFIALISVWSSQKQAKSRSANSAKLKTN